MNTEIFSFTNFKNKSVRNANGDTLGDVHDVVMDLKSGEIAYLVLASGGFLGLGEKHLPIPYEALQYDVKNKTFLMDVPKEKFEHAPHLDIKDSTNRIDNNYVKEIYSYYGYKKRV